MQHERPREATKFPLILVVAQSDDRNDRSVLAAGSQDLGIEVHPSRICRAPAFLLHAMILNFNATTPLVLPEATCFFAAARHWRLDCS